MAPLTLKLETLGLHSYRDVIPTTRLGYLGAFFLLIATYYALRIFYNLYLHPLRKYPGPFAARMGPYWKQYHELKLQKCHALYDAHKRYGRSNLKAEVLFEIKVLL